MIVDVTKPAAAIVAASAAVPAAVDAIQSAERLVLGVPLSVLLVSVVGSLIGVLLLRQRDTDRITPDDHVTNRWRRARQMASRVAALGLFVLVYAVVAAWLVALAGHFFPSVAGAPQLPLAGISGVLIRRMLPNYLAIAERVTGAIGGKR